MSSIPLSVTVYFFTFFYLLSAMLLPTKSPTERNAVALNNLPVLIIFPLIIVIDILWLLVYSCSDFSKVSLSCILGGGFGTLWAFIISKSNLSSLLYMTVMSNAQVCNRPSQQKMRCRKTMSSASAPPPAANPPPPAT